MTGKISVSLQNVSKKYRLFNTPKDRFLEAIHPFNKKYHKEFWAIRQINMRIFQGQTVGIIGRNGSGKSTLLQIICSILKPTSGEIMVNGRISALLELGAGFNPEFTGRENVFINGALMGFSREEMEERMLTIKTFADIGEFIDQPVKIYSSGMFVRLAFACAINVDPDILIVDEALAVGDAKFQHKCYQKFLEFQETGKTVILVTHDMGAVVKHCDYAFLLENGAIINEGEPNEVVNRYYELIFTGHIQPKSIDIPITQKNIDTLTGALQKSGGQSKLEVFLLERSDRDICNLRITYNKNECRYGDCRAEIVDFLCISGGSEDPGKISSGEVIDIYLKIKFHQTIDRPLLGFLIKTIDGIPIYGTNTRYSNIPIKPVHAYEYIIFKFSLTMNLQQGDYFIDLGIAEQLFDKDEPLDRRCELIHIFIQGNFHFEGITELETTITEISHGTLE